MSLSGSSASRCRSWATTRLATRRRSRCRGRRRARAAAASRCRTSARRARPAGRRPGPGACRAPLDTQPLGCTFRPMVLCATYELRHTARSSCPCRASAPGSSSPSPPSCAEWLADDVEFEAEEGAPLRGRRTARASSRRSSDGERIVFRWGELARRVAPRRRTRRHALHRHRAPPRRRGAVWGPKLTALASAAALCLA